MRNLLIIITFLATQILTACSEKKDVENEVVQVTEINEVTVEDDPEPPLPGFTSRFKTLEEWLFHISKNEKPQKAITTYNLDLFESKDQFILCLTGVNNYQLSENKNAIRIDFTPAEKYFTLPDSDFKNLDREKILERLNTKLHDFTTTDNFKKSFFSEAKSFSTSWGGEIWGQ